MPFKLNGKFFSFLGQFANFIILNLLCIVCSLPIITAGPAICSLYRCMMKISKKEDIHPFNEFFHGFRDNFRQGCILQLLMLLIGFFLYFDLKLILPSFGSSILFKILTCFFMMLGLVFLLTLTMLYPVQAQFSNTIFGTLKNALLLAVSHLPYTVVMLLLNLLPVILLLIWMNGFLFMVPFYIFLGFSVTCYLNCFFTKKIFRPYLPEDTSLSES